MESFLENNCMDNCSGCGACVRSCPVKSISFTTAEDGFVFPRVDENKCIHCRRCITVCPYSAEPKKNRSIQSYAVKARDAEVQKNSSSGGCFYGLARRIIEDGGVVFGAAMNSDFSCEHRPASNISELPLLMGSKYVQSRCDSVFPDVKICLEKNKPALFVGTPCQIAGLKNYLGKDPGNLITADIACHGVPSFTELRKCIEWLEKRHGGSVVYFKFRDKQYSGWNHSLTYCIEKSGRCKTYTVAPYKVPYYHFFLHSKNIRSSCYTCPYVGLERVGDITLADFWAAVREYPESEIGSGVSAALCNTEKGLTLLKRCEKYLVMREIDNTVATKDNQPFQQPPAKYPRRDALVREVQKHGYDHTALFYSRSERVVAALKAAVPEKMKRCLLRSIGGKQ